jgi:hypothetical protein
LFGFGQPIQLFWKTSVAKKLKINFFVSKKFTPPQNLFLRNIELLLSLGPSLPQNLIFQNQDVYIGSL